MSLSEALNKVSLKKTEQTRDLSNPDPKTGFMSDEDILRYQKNVLTYNFEQWISAIEQFTFKSVTVPLTKDHAKAFITHYASHHPEVQIKTTHEESEAARTSILSLEQEVSEKIKGLVEHPGDPVFVKTSCRSAKDAPVTQKRLKDLYKSYLSEMKDQDENDKVHALLKAGTELMKVFTAREALELMLSSERIFQDMQLALSVTDQWDNNLIIRQWVTIDVDMEFRCFVHNGKLNAISQYNHLVFFPRLLAMKEKLEQQIVEFWENDIRDRLKNKISDYIIDFAVVGERVWVIELNPFLETTDGALFSWQKERDLLEGKKGFEFRLRTEPAKGVRALLSVDWRDVILNN